jgi:hypothetical protein
VTCDTHTGGQLTKRQGVATARRHETLPIADEILRRSYRLENPRIKKEKKKGIDAPIETKTTKRARPKHGLNPQMQQRS